jgi:hypothetical protein
MAWYDPTSWFDDAPLDTDLTPQAAAAGFTSQSEYDQYIYDQSQQALYLAGGGGAEQERLGAGIVQESIGQYTVDQARAALPANVMPERAPYLFASGGSLGSVLAEAREGLNFSREVVALSNEAATLGDPVQVGSGPNAAIYVPRRTTGSGQPGTVAGPTGAGWGAAVNDLAANPERLLLSVAAGVLLTFAAKRLLRAA